MKLSEEEIIGKTHEELGFSIEICEEWDKLHKKVYETNSTVKSQTSTKMPDGNLYHFEVVLNPLHDKYGDIIGISGTTQDISERIKVELELKKSEHKYRKIFENVQDIFYQTDVNGIITEVSPSIERYSGFKVSEIIGKSGEVFYVNIEDRNTFLEQIKENGEVIDYELQLRTKDPNNLIYVSANTHVLYDEDNNPIGFEGTLRDITERKKVAKALEESEQRLTDMIDFLPDATFAIDQEGKVIAWNRAIEKMTGTRKHEILGEGDYAYSVPWYNERRPVLINLINEDKSEYISKYEYVLKEGKTVYAEVFVPSVYNGRGADLWVRASPLLDKEGQSYGAIESVRDISDRKNAEKEIKKSLKEKEVLLREIHHRVKNNMQIVSSLLNLQIQYEDLDETVGVLKESQGRVKSMAIIHEKLYQSSSFSEINFKEYIENLLLDIFYSYGVKTGEIESELDIQNIHLNIETAIPLGLIINELLTNTIKYAFPNCKGNIKIKLESKNDFIELSIADDGIGISEDIDLENSKTLGFQLVENLVNQLDGELKLIRNHGTEFIITFKELKYKKRL